MTATALTSQSGTCGPGGEGSLLIGVSPHVRELRLLAPRLAQWPGHASVVGPTGVGKALFASEVFRYLPPGTYRRRSVATEHEDLIEGQWLGWVKGAFTGAVADNPGLLGLMAHGHVFLDEAQLIHTQPKLRRILLDAAEGEGLYRLGATRPYSFAGRFILGSQRPLRALHAEGILPDDLFERLDGPEVVLLPLAARREDIPPLARHFLAQVATVMALAEAIIADDAMSTLIEHHWPRNVRELRTAIRKAVWNSGVVPGDGLIVQRQHLGVDLLARTAVRVGRRPKATPEGIAAAVRQNGGTKAAAAELGVSQRTVQRRARGLGSRTGA